MSIDAEQCDSSECVREQFELQDYHGDVPRWCRGCGDLTILNSVKKTLRDGQIDPTKVVCVSGIGCSSRFPHYLKTYGFHGIHGRALPISTGIALARPDLHVMTVMGDGDCFSIGAGHWLHALRYNIDIMVLVFDNAVYGLTKMQASPTTPEGMFTNTTPGGAYLKALNPLTVMLGVTNISFLAQTATWLAGHLDDTIKKAWEHKGLSFVRIVQRCPVYMPQAGFTGDKKEYPAVFLENENGIPVNKGYLKEAPTIAHDHGNMHEAHAVSYDPERIPMGLIYWDPKVPTYGDIRNSRKSEWDPKTLVSRLGAEFDKYSVTTK